MRRREFITFAGAGLVACPLRALAQQPRRIGVIMNGLPTDRALQARLTTFEQGLRILGWRNGQNLHIDYRWYSGNVERARADVADLVALKPDLIVTSSSTVLIAAMKATRTIPIVFMAVSDPVAQGFVSNLARPGGNVTGFATLEYSVGGKWVDLLNEVAPSLARVAFLFNPVSFPQFKHFMETIEVAASSMGIAAVPVPLGSRVEIEPAFRKLIGQPNTGLIVPTDTALVVHHEQIVELAARHRLPAIYARRAYVNGGGLMFYGTEGTNEAERGAAAYVDRILKGANPGDLPVQAPVNFRLVINAKALQTLGLEMPLSLMLRADEVIE